MKNISGQSTLANDLANAMLKDIQDSKLKEGDYYYTTEEAGKKFGVCKDTARKAMTILADRNILVRLRRRGTFIGAMAQPQKMTVSRKILVLMPDMPYGMPAIPYSQFPYYLDRAIDNASIQSCIIPRNEDVAVVKQMVEAAGQLDGIVTDRRPRNVHNYLTETKIPVAFLFTPDSGQPNLPTLDFDYYEAGRLLAEHIVSQKHRNVIVQLFGDYSGDHNFADSIADTMSAAHLPPSSLKIRTFCGDLEIARANFRDLLSKKEHPTAIIANGEDLADIAAVAINDVGLTVGKDVEIVWSANMMKIKNHSPYINAQPKLSMDEVATIVAKMLEDQRKHGKVEENRIIIPAELCQP